MNVGVFTAMACFRARTRRQPNRSHSISTEQHVLAKALWLHYTKNGLWPSVELDFKHIWCYAEHTQPQDLVLFGLPYCARFLQQELNGIKRDQRRHTTSKCER